MKGVGMATVYSIRAWRFFKYNTTSFLYYKLSLIEKLNNHTLRFSSSKLNVQGE